MTATILDATAIFERRRQMARERMLDQARDIETDRFGWLQSAMRQAVDGVWDNGEILVNFGPPVNIPAAFIEAAIADDEASAA